MKSIKKSAVLPVACFFLGFTVCIYAPYEMYLANKSEFWFSLYNFWWLPICFGAFAILCGIIVGMLLKRWKLIERIYISGIFGLALCFYLQGNFLNLDIGVINGSVVNWGQYKTRMLLDALIWILVIVGVLIAAVKKWDICRKVILCISLFFTATQAVSFLALTVTNYEEFGRKPDTTFLSNEGLFEVSSDENILIFLMDAFDDSYMKDIVEKSPEYLDELSGFTYFSNMTGSYPSTLYSVQYLLSGYYNFNVLPFAEWRSQLDSMPMYWDDLCDKGWKYYLYEDAPVEMAMRVYRGSENYENVSLKIGNYFGFMHDLYQFVACRYFPDIFKPFIWLDGSEFVDFKKPEYGEYVAFDYFNQSFLNSMAENFVTARNSGKMLKFIHLEGCHGPNYLNENGEMQDVLTEPENSARGCIRIIGNYMQQMKELGCYDNSAIIIMADHGYSKDGVLTNPVFMVKPKGATGKIRISDAPVSHANYPATIMQLAGESEDAQKYGRSVFDIGENESIERYFYQYYYEHELENMTLRLIEYQIEPVSNKRESFHLTDVEYTVKGDKIQHSRYCRLCKAGGITEEQLQEYDPPREYHEKDNNYQEVLKEN